MNRLRLWVSSSQQMFCLISAQCRKRRVSFSHINCKILMSMFWFPENTFWTNLRFINLTLDYNDTVVRFMPVVQKGQGFNPCVWLSPEEHLGESCQIMIQTTAVVTPDESNQSVLFFIFSRFCNVTVTQPVKIISKVFQFSLHTEDEYFT